MTTSLALYELEFDGVAADVGLGDGDADNDGVAEGMPAVGDEITAVG